MDPEGPCTILMEDAGESLVSLTDVLTLAAGTVADENRAVEQETTLAGDDVSLEARLIDKAGPLTPFLDGTNVGALSGDSGKWPELTAESLAVAIHAFLDRLVGKS